MEGLKQAIEGARKDTRELTDLIAKQVEERTKAYERMNGELDDIINSLKAYERMNSELDEIINRLKRNYDERNQ